MASVSLISITGATPDTGDTAGDGFNGRIRCGRCRCRPRLAGENPAFSNVVRAEPVVLLDVNIAD